MAKKFRFRAAVVLKLREQREQLAQRAFAEAQGLVLRIQDDIRTTRQRLAEQDALVREGVLTGTVDVQYMSLYRRHVMTLHRSLLGQIQELREALQRVQQVRGELLEAVKGRKVMSAYRDRLAQRHQDEADRAERLELDEMATTRAGFLRTSERAAT